MISDTRAQLATTEWQRWSTEMQIVVTDQDSLDRARQEVEAELDAVEAAASRFRPDSEINMLTESCGRPTVISELLTELLAAALDAAIMTDGDVDPTLGAAMISLGYDREFAGIDCATEQPVTLTIPAAWSMIALSGRVCTVPPGVVLDLGATAKAIASDRCAKRVYAATGSGVLINLGGDIATAGPAPEGNWQVLVQDEDEEPASSVGLCSGAGMATSSTIRRRWRRGQAPVHHILNPHTGRSADPVWRTVSVAARTCFAANTISTAAIVRGRRAVDWIGTLGLPAWLVDNDGVVHTVGGWPAADQGGNP
jgi:thiamine biosynthesis lipoprotein